MALNAGSGPSASPCPGKDLGNVARPLFEGFGSLFEQVQLLGRQHASLERKLALAQAQVSQNTSLFYCFLRYYDEICIALDLELHL